MTVTTPSGYVAVFKDIDELNYGERRDIQKVLFRNTRAKFSDTDILFASQDDILSIVLISIRVGDRIITSNFVSEIRSWKKLEDGDAVYAKTADYIDQKKIFGDAIEEEGKKK